jgi:transcription elongation GreA/GreB family factor
MKPTSPKERSLFIAPGKALINKKTGDTVVLKGAKGDTVFEIIGIDY